MAVTGYAGFRQGTTAITDFLPGTRRLRRKGPFPGPGISGRLCRETNCDLDKFDPVVRDWIKESRRAVRIGAPGSLQAAGAAGPWDPPAPPPGHRRAAVSHRLRPVPSRFVTAQSSLPTMMVCSASSGAMTRLLVLQPGLFG